LSDLPERARGKTNDAIWNYIQGGAGSESTVRGNEAAFDRWLVQPRALVDVGRIRLDSTFLGQAVGAPFFLAPTAYQGLVHPDGERATARAAASHHALAVFSTLSSRSMEAIARCEPMGPRWFQLYLQPDIESSRKLVKRAEAAGFGAIVVTVDTVVLGNRDRQIRSGFAMESSVLVGNGADILPPHRVLEAPGSELVLRPDCATTWEILNDLRKTTKLPLIVKGVLSAHDALQAKTHGAAAVIVSNHGGRQLDRAPAALSVLPEVVAAVGKEVEVYVDGGFRRGGDVLIALALGARGVGVGRPALWALAAGGETGVARLITLLKIELATAMALCGRRDMGEIDATALRPAASA
jgi:4-hydroxymandelate oxidase